MEKQVLFFGACYYCGLIKLVRWWTQRSGKHLIILNYHRASGTNLYRHLLYLKRYYRLMHLEEALEELYAPYKQKRQICDRRTPLVLTFDDGYHDNFTHAYALACKLQVPITIFLIPGYIESGHCFWWLEGNRLVQHAQIREAAIEGHNYCLEQQEEREALAQAIYTRAYHASSIEEREAFLAMVADTLAVQSTTSTEGETGLTWPEVRTMQESGWVSFGAHTLHHPVLAYLRDSTEVQREVSDCCTVLEQQLGRPIRTFAYPLGKPEHIGELALQAVQDAGYAWAVTTINGTNTPRSDPYLLRRVPADANRHWLLMAAQITGVWQFFAPLMLRGRKLLSVGENVLILPLRLLKSR